jgi:sulfhydrogenase subunit alpha
MSGKKKILKISALARVEGEGGILIETKDGRVTKVRLNIFEAPRLFESFLRGRHFAEVPDITARICGICPVAYQMSSTHAMEKVCGIVLDGQLRELRRLLYCGEWIESHALHVFLLHAPGFLGYADVMQMSKDHREVVLKGLQIKKVGNEILSLMGGREIHPVNVRVGGFYRVPAKGELSQVGERLKWARDAALEMVRWTAALPFPEFEQEYEFVAMRHPAEYPLNEGRIVSSKGLDIGVNEYDDYFGEEQAEHSSALRSARKGGGAYITGPLARYSINFDRFSRMVREAAKEAGLGTVCRNPFQSIIVRSLEILYACEEGLRIIKGYEMPERPFVEVLPRGGTGYGCTEAPRGILYHRYTVDDAGIIHDAKIVPPTSQNQRIIEEDLYQFASAHTTLSKDELTLRCEQVVRNYDPCISCATH